MDISSICEDYKNFKGINTIAKEYHIGALKVKQILKDNGVQIRDAHSPRINHIFIVPDYHIKKYPEEDGFEYVAVSKLDGTRFFDHENKGGFLTGYIKKVLGIKIPTLYDRRIYYQETGNYWWEQWFDIIKEPKKDSKKCPYCDWETNDVDNKSGAFTYHLQKIHNISIEEHLKKYPEDKEYLNNQNKIIEKKNFLRKKENYIICPICNNKFEKITYWHIKYSHNMDYDDFKKQYPDVCLVSDNMLKQSLNAQKLGNLVVSKNRLVSKYERELQDFLTEHNICFSPNRQILIGKEIDLLINDKKIGIEFDGLKFHTEWFGKKSHSYHLEKTLKCNEKGFGLIHIFEDEYVNHKDIVLSKISHILGIENKDKPKAFGRKCVIKEIFKKDAEDFLNKFHIQGFSSSSIYLGAFYNGELIGVMSFKNGNLKNPNWELTRFATNYNLGMIYNLTECSFATYEPLPK